MLKNKLHIFRCWEGLSQPFVGNSFLVVLYNPIGQDAACTTEILSLNISTVHWQYCADAFIE